MTKDALRRWREEQQWTLEQAAWYLGTTKTSMHRWETGVHPIPTTIAILAALLVEEKNARKVERLRVLL